jgi:tetratricopeptide (TPR) repeat protein
MFYTFSSAGIYSGISLSGNYLYLNAEKTDKSLYTVKPGIGIDLGIAYRFSSLFSGRLGFSYGFVPLTNGSLPNLSVYAGFAYSLSDISETAANEAEAEEFRNIKQADELYNTGMKRFRERDLTGAKNKFLQAVSAYKKHADSEIMLEKISAYEKDFSYSLQLSESGRYYEALPLLEKLAPVMKEAETELFRIRSLLLPGVQAMEKTGIAAYENRDYENCIAIMKKISLIDPANSTASIYLPKARKRLEAVKKFR